MGSPGHRRERITVLIVTFQHERYIAQCVDSVLAQQVDADLEVLIGEDASTDRTREICMGYAGDPRVQVILRSPDQRKIHINGHPTGRANLLDLMARASGDLVIRIDGDDHWSDPRKLQVQLEALRRDPAAMGCYHQTARIDEAGRPVGQVFRKDLPERLTYEDVIDHLAPFHVSSFLYRNIPEVRRPPALARRVGSLDLLLFALVAYRGHLIKVPGESSCYRMHTGGISRTGLYARSNDLRLRILLWTGLVRLKGGAGRAKAFRICDDHLAAARDMAITAWDARRWAWAMLLRPAYFLGRSYRWRTGLRIVVNGWRAGSRASVPQVSS